MPRPRFVVKMCPRSAVTEQSTIARMRPLAQLGSNENALGPSPSVEAAVRRAVSEGNRYPRTMGLELRTMIADANDVSPDQIFITNGSSDALLAIGATHLVPGDRTVVADPTFYLHIFMTERHGGELALVPTKSFRQDVDGLLAVVDDRTRVFVITNPHNPTGSVVDRSELDRIVGELDARGGEILLVIDEAYREYADEGAVPDGVELVRAGHNVAVTRTFSKAYGLAAMRVGYAIVSAAAAMRLRDYIPPFAVNSASLAAAEAAFADQEHLFGVIELNRRERDRLTRVLADLGMAPAPSQANFVVATGLDDPAGIASALAEEGIIVRPTEDDFGLRGGLRFTTGRTEEISRVIDALQKMGARHE